MVAKLFEVLGVAITHTLDPTSVSDDVAIPSASV